MPARDRVQAHPDSYVAELRADVRAGLTAEPKSLPPKYLYDVRGSELFEEITRLPEYYPTRAETAILRARAGEIAELSRCESLVELGSGTSAKTGLLLRALRESGTLREFMPFDGTWLLTEVASNRLDHGILLVSLGCTDSRRVITSLTFPQCSVPEAPPLASNAGREPRLRPNHAARENSPLRGQSVRRFEAR